jgi:murein DD-endopeptidase MepM/ murein hydrolase activator NlpD
MFWTFAASFSTFSTLPASAEENWKAMVWDGDVRKLEQLGSERGITSRDVFWANGYKDLPPEGETLLVPNSKNEVLLTWMEVQNRKNGAEPLVTVKLHGVPGFTREQTPPKTLPVPQKPAAPEQTPKMPKKPAAVPSSPAKDVKNMTVMVSGDELIIATAKGEIIQEKPSSENSAAGERPVRPVTLKVTSETLASLPPLILKPPARTPPQPKPPAGVTPPPSEKMMWPVSGKVSSGFGRRGKRHFHAGIDIPMPQGTAIAAAKDGVVLEVSTAKGKKYRGYGNAALIDHGDGITALYAHCQSISVKAGQKVKRGDIVGRVGNTGRTTTHHIHFEVRKNGKAVDPIPYLTPR